MKTFNFNDGGRSAAGFQGSTRDCVVRAIAIATSEPYQLVYDALNGLGKQERPRHSRKYRSVRSASRTGVHRRTYEKFLFERGWVWTPTMAIGSGCKVHLRGDELPSGVVIASVSRHLVTVVDGIIQDTYDCSRTGTRCVYGYYAKGLD